MSGAGNAVNNDFNTATFWADLQLEMTNESDKQVREIHELQKKLLLDRLEFEKRLKIKQDAELEVRKIKVEEELKKRAQKKAFKDKEEEIKYQQKLEKKYQKQSDKERFQEIQRHYEELNKQEGFSLSRNIEAARKLLDVKGWGKQLGEAAAKALINTGKFILDEGTKSVNSAMTMYSGVYSKINARLQTGDSSDSKRAQSIFDLMNRNLAASPYVKYEDMLNNTASLIERGIAYNVEERAFLMTIKDKIADTFEVANGALLNIIRIQQEDSTRARLGMEASLTKFLNSNFQDTSYLSDVYDTVTDAVADSVVQLGTKGGAEYEYQLQKWLGSLYSIGLSSNTVSNLASAINMLSTGDVSGLANSGMQNLLVMAANKSGMNYGDLLTQGVNAQNVNALMSNIVSYWSELAQNNNQVVRKQYSELFGLDMSDLVAIRNVDQGLLNDLIGTNLTYTGMQSELTSQLSKVGSRMHKSELINNMYQNAIQGIGRNIANSPGMMATWLINDLIKQSTGGINIPSISTMFGGIDLETDVNSLIQLGMVGIGTMGQISNIIAGLNANGGLNLQAWKSTDTTTRGTGLGGVVSGVTSSTSKTTFVGNAASSDIYSSTLNAAYDSVDTSVANEAQEEADEMKTAITKHIDPNIEAILDILRAVSSGSSIRVRVEDYGLTSPF